MKTVLVLAFFVLAFPQNLVALPPKDDEAKYHGLMERHLKKKQLEEALKIKKLDKRIEELARIRQYEKAYNEGMSKLGLDDKPNAYKTFKSAEKQRAAFLTAWSFLKWKSSVGGDEENWSLDVMRFVINKRPKENLFRERFGTYVLTHVDHPPKLVAAARIREGMKLMRPLAKKNLLTGSGWYTYFEALNEIDDAREIYDHCTNREVLAKVRRPYRYAPKSKLLQAHTPCPQRQAFYEARPPKFTPTRKNAVLAFRRGFVRETARRVLHLRPHLQEHSLAFTKKKPDPLVTLYAIALLDHSGWPSKDAAVATMLGKSWAERLEFAILIASDAYAAKPKDRWYQEALGIVYLRSRDQKKVKLGRAMLDEIGDDSLSIHGFRALTYCGDPTRAKQAKEKCREKAKQVKAPDGFCR